jgi:hypothetical protein
VHTCRFEKVQEEKEENSFHGPKNTRTGTPFYMLEKQYLQTQIATFKKLVYGCSNK